ncbi:hypothetical protein S245_059519, partial [Arachis hypogaea]
IRACEDAIVYLDAGSTEFFQFIGAYPILVDLGAQAICNLESMSVLDAGRKCSPFLVGNTRSDQLIQFGAYSLGVSGFTSGPDAYHEYESLLVDVPHIEASSSGRDTEDAVFKLDASVHHFPMILCPLSSEHEDSIGPGFPPFKNKRWGLTSKENITVNVKSRPGFVTKPELQAMIKALTGSQSSLLKNKAIIQIASATLFALEESNCTKWDAFSSAEKILSVSSGETSQSFAAQIGDLINKSALLGSQ